MPPTRAPALLAAGAALAVAGMPLPGCGAQGPTDQDAVRAKLVEFTNASRAKRYARICDRVLDPALVAKVEETGLPCEAAMERLLKGVEDPRLTIGRVRVTGDTASAEIRTSAAGQRPSRDIAELVKHDAGWRISKLAGASPPSPGVP